MALRHLTSIDDLSNAEIEQIFSRAEHYLKELGNRLEPFRIARSANICAGRIMAALFYEPSTRTRLSFESAIARLGGQAISSADPATSSAAKGETLADTVRIVSAYSDLIVLRHPREGAAKLAAEYASVPVVNGGDGANEHPTQTLCDLFAIRREKGRLEGLNVALLGDLKNSRTIHSLAWALARFGANLFLMPAPGMELPGRLTSQIVENFDYAPLRPDANIAGVSEAYGPRGRGAAIASARIDVLYLTRFQKERWTESAASYPRVNAAFLNEPQFSEALVLHPLPRAGELDPDFDADARAGYFRQASYGVPVRMALVSLLLEPFESGAAKDATPRALAQGPSGASDGAVCSNANCISRAESQSRFEPAQSPLPRQHCAYCGHEAAT